MASSKPTINDSALLRLRPAQTVPVAHARLATQHRRGLHGGGAGQNNEVQSRTHSPRPCNTLAPAPRP
eukprot:5560954-Lingulodinium_polyedra.AAC.1